MLKLNNFQVAYWSDNGGIVRSCHNGGGALVGLKGAKQLEWHVLTTPNSSWYFTVSITIFVYNCCFGVWKTRSRKIAKLKIYLLHEVYALFPRKFLRIFLLRYCFCLYLDVVCLSPALSVSTPGPLYCNRCFEESNHVVFIYNSNDVCSPQITIKIF